MAIVNFADRFTSGFNEDALTTTTSGEYVFNFGRLKTVGDLANGIFGDANDVSIRNLGSIETFGVGAAGIFANGENAHIDNFGSVVTHGGFYDPDPNVDGDEFFSEGLFANGDRFQIANYGSVNVEGEFSSGLVGVGADGIVINHGRVNDLSQGSVTIGAFGTGRRRLMQGR